MDPAPKEGSRPFRCADLGVQNPLATFVFLCGKEGRVRRTERLVEVTSRHVSRFNGPWNGKCLGQFYGSHEQEFGSGVTV